MRLSAFVLCLLSCLGVPAFAVLPATAPRPVPLSFEPNQGQAPQTANFITHVNGADALFSATGIQLVLPTRDGRPQSIELQLLNASPSQPVSLQPLPGESNYLLGNDPALWRRHVPNFAQLRYSSVYPGVDLLFHGHNDRLEHDFRVTPGADPASIAFRLTGASSLRLTPAGDLILRYGEATLQLDRPVAYQTGPRGRTRVVAEFALAPDHTIRFRLGRYDHSRDLIIDPTLTYSTFLDRSPIAITSVGTDSAGDTFIAGYTFYSSYPTTSGAVQTTCSACAANHPVAFVTKLDPTGTHLLYSTFLGGSGYNDTFAFAVDSRGDAIVGGRTESTDFPVHNNIGSGTTGNNGTFGFISSLSPDGSSLNFSSVFAGGSNTIVTHIATGTSDEVTFAGSTNSPNFPTTAGALHAETPQYPHTLGFVTRVTSAGNLIWSALPGRTDIQYGDGSLEGISGLAVDAQGNTVIAGGASDYWPITPGAYQATRGGQIADSTAFLARISSDGSSFAFSTFLPAGGSAGVALDSTGAIDVVLLGGTDPNTPPSLTRMSADGSQLLHSTRIDGAATGLQTTPSVITLDGSGNIWLSGHTSDTAFPLLHPLDGVIPSPEHQTGFLTEFDNTATTMKFATFFGGPSTGIDGMAFDPSGTLHIVGSSISSGIGSGPNIYPAGLYTTPGALIPTVPAAPSNYDYTYGYFALIQPAQPSAALCVQPQNALSATGAVSVGGSVSTMTTLSSCGELPLVLSSLQSSSPLFTASTNCPASIPAGTSCTLTTTFKPTSSGTFNATLSIASNSSVPVATLPLGGTGYIPSLVLSPAALNFGNVAPQTTSSPQTVTLSNQSAATVYFSVETLASSSPFRLTATTCATSLAPSASCSLTLTFTPPSLNRFDDDIFISSSGPELALVLILSGTGATPAPALTTYAGAPTSVAVSAGLTASYDLAVSSIAGFSGTLTPTCSGLPQFASCTFAPASVSLAAGSSTHVVLQVATKTTTSAALSPFQMLGPGSFLAVLILPCIRRRSLAVRSLPWLSVVLLAAITGCGSGGGNQASPTPTPTAHTTPPGSYVITVSISQGVSIPLTLVVQ